MLGGTANRRNDLMLEEPSSPLRTKKKMLEAANAPPENRTALPEDSEKDELEKLRAPRFERRPQKDDFVWGERVHFASELPQPRGMRPALKRDDRVDVARVGELCPGKGERSIERFGDFVAARRVCRRRCQ